MDHRLFLSKKKSLLEAPAGYGKTTSIVKCLEFCEGKQLILTHTHAGVASLKKKMKVSQETVESLFTVLKQADLVKFAKSTPLEFEITNDRNRIQKAILTLDEAIPVEVAIEDDTILNEARYAI